MFKKLTLISGTEVWVNPGHISHLIKNERGQTSIFLANSRVAGPAFEVADDVQAVLNQLGS